LKAIPEFTSEIECVPLSDGGDGFQDCMFRALPDATQVKVTVTGPLGESIEAEYCLHSSTATAYIEVANASGLKLVKPEDRDPYKAT